MPELDEGGTKLLDREPDLLGHGGYALDRTGLAPPEAVDPGEELTDKNPKAVLHQHVRDLAIPPELGDH